jgi:hypothetical protein
MRALFSVAHPSSLGLHRKTAYRSIKPSTSLLLNKAARIVERLLIVTVIVLRAGAIP